MAKNLMTDELNCRLVAALQKEGRMSHAELAERLGERPTSSTASSGWRPRACLADTAPW